MVLKTREILVIFLLVILTSCNSSSLKNNEVSKDEVENVVNAKSLYTLHCEACHGMDGTKGISGAANLKISKLSNSQIKNMILHGNDKGMMPFKDIITSKTELDSLTVFVKSLQK